jgi:hypothetical protein
MVFRPCNWHNVWEENLNSEISLTTYNVQDRYEQYEAFTIKI